MHTPRILHSVLEQAEKGNMDPFSVYKVPVVATRRLQHRFTKGVDALVPIYVNWETSSPGSGNFEEEKATAEERVKWSFETAKDFVCVITDNAFDRAEDLMFRKCTE